MSLNAMHRSIMIFSDDYDNAIKKLNELASSINGEILMRTKDYIRTANKTIQARKFSEGCRGFRYMDVYVDKTLSDNIEIMFSIRAKLVPPHYYKNFEYDENYNWKEHVFYFE